MVELSASVHATVTRSAPDCTPDAPEMRPGSVLLLMSITAPASHRSCASTTLLYENIGRNGKSNASLHTPRSLPLGNEMSDAGSEICAVLLFAAPSERSR